MSLPSPAPGPASAAPPRPVSALFDAPGAAPDERRGKKAGWLRLPGGTPALVAFAISLVAFTVQTEAAQYVQQGLGYRKPFLSLYLGHSSFLSLLPLHLGYLRLRHPSLPLSHHLHLIAQNLHWQLTPRRRAPSLPPTAERVRQRLSSFGSLGRSSIASDEGGWSVEAARSSEPRERAAPRYDGWLQETCGFDPFRLLGLLGVLTVGITVPALSWYSAVPLTTMADVTTIYNTYAVWALVFSIYFLGEKWERRKVLAVLLAVGGVVLVAYGGAEHRRRLREPDPVYGKPGGNATTTVVARSIFASLASRAEEPPAGDGDAAPKGSNPVLGALLSFIGAVTMAGYEMAFALLGKLPDEAAQAARYAARAARRPTARGSVVEYSESEGLLDGQEEQHVIGDDAGEESDGDSPSKAAPSDRPRKLGQLDAARVSTQRVHDDDSQSETSSDAGDASASSLSEDEVEEVQRGSTRLSRARSATTLPTAARKTRPPVAGLFDEDSGSAAPASPRPARHRSDSFTEWIPPPLPFGLHANLMTAGIGGTTLCCLWIGIPIAHALGWETFELPHNWTTVGCLLLVMGMGVIFNSCFMILLALWGPVLASVSCLLTTVLVFFADLALGHEFRWISLLGCVTIAAGFGVLASGDGMASHH